MNNTKESEIVAHGFHVADLCLPYAKQKIIDLKYIQASSILLSGSIKVFIKVCAVSKIEEPLNIIFDNGFGEIPVPSLDENI